MKLDSDVWCEGFSGNKCCNDEGHCIEKVEMDDGFNYYCLNNDHDKTNLCYNSIGESYDAGWSKH